jgi:hypothetical protein
MCAGVPRFSVAASTASTAVVTDAVRANCGDGRPGTVTSSATASAVHNTTAIRVRVRNSDVITSRIAAMNFQNVGGTSGWPSSRAIAGLIGRYFTVTAAPAGRRRYVCWSTLMSVTCGDP